MRDAVAEGLREEYCLARVKDEERIDGTSTNTGF